MPYLKTNDGAELYYEERGRPGSGPSLVFVPGFTMPVRWFSNQLEDLSDEFHCVCYDLRAQGQSSKVDYGGRTARYGRDLHDVLAALEIEKSIPIGWSLGGQVVLAYVDLFGTANVAGLVIVESGPPDTKRPDWTYAMGTEAENQEFANLITADMPQFAEVMMGMMFHKEMPAEFVSEMTELTLQTPPKIAYNICRDALYSDYRDLMPNIDVPTLLAIGRYGLIPPEAQEYLRDQISGSQMVFFEESGHSPFVEEPEAFNKAIREFANSVSSEGVPSENEATAPA
jgi:peroxiredoxin